MFSYPSHYEGPNYIDYDERILVRQSMPASKVCKVPASELAHVDIFELPYISHQYLQWSPYGNGCEVEAANVLEAMQHSGCLIDDYGQYGVVAWLPDTADNREMLSKLADYPLLSDDLSWELVILWEGEAFTDYVKGDISRELSDELSDVWDSLSEDLAYALYRDAMESSNTYPEIESGDAVYIDIDRILPYLITDLTAELAVLDGSLGHCGDVPND